MMKMTIALSQRPGYTEGMKVQDSLRKAVRDSGLPQRQIALGAGVGVSPLCRFMGGASLRGEHIDKLATYFKMKLAGSTRRKGN